MKIAISLALMLCMLVSVPVPMTVYAEGTSDFDITAEAFADGNTVTVRVGVKNVTTPLDALCAELVYDPAVLTLQNVTLEEDELDCVVSMPDDTWENLCISADGKVLLRACGALCGAQITDETPIVFEVRFAIASNFETTELYIPQDSVEGVDRNLDYRYGNGTSLLLDGSIDILYGDVNGDGAIDGRDSVRLMQYLANIDYQTGTSSVEIARGADCNGDGTIDGRDSVRLLRYLASIEPETGTSSVLFGA